MQNTKVYLPADSPLSEKFIVCQYDHTGGEIRLKQISTCDTREEAEHMALETHKRNEMRIVILTEIVS